MYAIIKTGGKQYKVEEGKFIDVEKLPNDLEQQVEFKEVLLISDGSNVKLGNPNLENAKVLGKVLKQDKHKKVIVYKMRPKKHYRRKNGHRQPFTRVLIEKILA
ncbi:MAG: 50S ribosomal protein L21 [Candidatus Sericytochromatia bacterium]|nr:MAG: 50S ribosomal protein L21 [Candidatus Sericytochromatia bacterium]